MIRSANENGLSEDEVRQSLTKYGSNSLVLKQDNVFLDVLKGIVLEPMFVILLITCIIYFSVGQQKEGIIMLISLFIVAGISIFQDYRSRNAVKALQRISQSKAKVKRNGKIIEIDVDAIVTSDLLFLEEGEIIAADGLIITASDFSINESILTGEAFPVSKSAGNNAEVYRGTMVVTGSAVIVVNAVGSKTMFGKIGISLSTIAIPKTPLQKQIHDFVKYMVGIGFVAFILIVFLNYYHSHDIIKSFLNGLTLAMSILPEEIPVAFSTFQALGAYRLLKKHNIIVKQPQYVETLGAATVICADKTGTLTQNKMTISGIYDVTTKSNFTKETFKQVPIKIIEYAMWSSEVIPYDPMEKAIHELYEKSASSDKRKVCNQIHEYPLGGKPPFMTHIFSDGAAFIIAAKGAPEAIARQSNLTEVEMKLILDQAQDFAKKGYRVLGIGEGKWPTAKWPVAQEEFNFEFLGLIAFQDPPKESISETIKQFHQAGISLKMITGDFPETALAIASQIGLSDNKEVLTGNEILLYDNNTLREKVKNVDIFARMFPEAKLKVIDALKENGEVVAMTGDGVNDGPALKSAHIGIAMGTRGSEVAKSAAALILTDDDLSHMVDAVAAGRKIYDNLKKAIQYIVSIHIPIILIVVLPLILAWHFTTIFTPVHVIFLELIMGPTCSIIYENEPMEPSTMQRKPLIMGTSFLSFKQLSMSLIQGLFITGGCLLLGFYYLQNQASNETVRTFIFITLLFSNIFLTLINRSFRFTILKTFFYKNNLVVLILVFSAMMIFLFLFVPYLRNIFGLSLLSFREIAVCMLVALISTGWVEVYKFFKYRNQS
jgi:Ca2+-transporting ATPase